jgi:hypothetical protein
MRSGTGRIARHTNNTLAAAAPIDRFSVCSWCCIVGGKVKDVYITCASMVLPSYGAAHTDMRRNLASSERLILIPMLQPYMEWRPQLRADGTYTAI